MVPAGRISGMSRIRLVVFDIAGTIIEDHGEVARAFTKALMENGIPFVEDELKRWKGASKREVIRNFVKQADSKGDIDQKVENSSADFARNWRASIRRSLSLSEARLIRSAGARITTSCSRLPPDFIERSAI